MSDPGGEPLETDGNARAESVFFDLLRLADDDREAEAERLCAGDPVILARVRELLAADREAEGGGANLQPPPEALRLPFPRRRASTTGPPESLGPYLLERRIGGGGMGEVWLAHHRALDRRVAVKIMKPGFLDDPRRRERFEREIHLAGKVDHPAIVRALHADESDGVLYLVMEYVEGEDFQQLVDRRGPLPPEEAVELVRQAAEALVEVHRLGIVHRDVKPSNLMRSVAGEVKLLDLGIAWSPELLGASGRLTESMMILGSLPYMAPEQIAAAHEVDVRADLHALGATLHFLLVGEPPARSLTISGLGPRAGSVIPLASTLDRIPSGLRPILARLLAESPDQRPGDPSEVIRDLDGWLVKRQPRAIRQTRRRKFASFTLLPVAGLGGAGIVAWGTGLMPGDWLMNGLEWLPPNILQWTPTSPPQWLQEWRPFLETAARIVYYLALLAGFVRWWTSDRRRLVVLWLILILVGVGSVGLWVGPSDVQQVVRRAFQPPSPALSSQPRPMPAPSPSSGGPRWKQVRQAIHRHLDGLGEGRAGRVLFVMAWDLPGAPIDRQLEALRATPAMGAARSWAEVAVVGAWRVVAFDLAPNWSRRDWERRLRGYPYGLAFNDSESSALDEQLGRSVPFVVRADWLLCSEGPEVGPEAAAVIAAVKKARDRDLDLAAAALELGFEPDGLRAVLDDPGLPASRGLKPLAEGGVISRASWENESTFENAARDLLDAVPQSLQ